MALRRVQSSHSKRKGDVIYTLKDVAKRAGVTVTTVSRAINNRGYISEKTRNKINEVMQEMNYSPNEVARSLSMKHTKIIGIIVPSLTHPFFANIVNCVEAQASRQSYKLMVCNSNKELEKEKEYISILKSNKVSGIIISSRTPNICDELDSTESLPIVFLERTFENNSISVCCDNFLGGVLATEHLIEKGCKNLIMFGGVEGTKLPADLRYEGFKEVCEKRNISYKMFQTEEEDFLSMRYEHLIEKTIVDNPDVDGIFASSDIIAARVLQICHKHKIDVPNKMKIVGFDDIPISNLTIPEITTIRQPVELMSKLAVDAIINTFNDKSITKRVVLPVTLVVRGTT